MRYRVNIEDINPFDNLLVAPKKLLGNNDRGSNKHSLPLQRPRTRVNKYLDHLLVKWCNLNKKSHAGEL